MPRPTTINLQLHLQSHRPGRLPLLTRLPVTYPHYSLYDMRIIPYLADEDVPLAELLDDVPLAALRQ